MIRTITISGRTGVYKTPSFLLTETEPLTIRFYGLCMRSGRFVATVVHGEQRKTVFLDKNAGFDLFPEWLQKGGENPLEIFLELRDFSGLKILIPSAKDKNDTSGFFIEPLKIEKTEDGYNMVAWLKEIETKFKNLDTRVRTMENSLSEFEDDGVPLIFEEE